MSESETDFDPTPQTLQSNQLYFEKHIQTIQNGSFFAVALSISTLGEIDYTDEKIRSSLLTSNLQNHLILLFNPEKFTQVDSSQIKKLREDVYALCDKICQDDYAVQCFSQRLDLTLNNIDQQLAIPQILGYLSRILRNPQVQQDFIQKSQFLIQILKQSVQQMFTYNVVTRKYTCNKQISDSLQMTVINTLKCYQATLNSRTYRELYRGSAIELITQLLYSQTQVIRHRTTEILQILLNSASFPLFLPHLQHFTTLLNNQETAEFLYSASHILVKIALLDNGDKILTQNGAIQPIIQLLSSLDRKIKDAACQVIIGIAKQNDTVNVKICDIFCIQGAIQVIVDGIMQEVGSKQKEAEGPAPAEEKTQFRRKTVQQADLQLLQNQAKPTTLSLLLNALALVCTSRECQNATRSQADLQAMLIQQLDSLNPHEIKHTAQAIAEMCKHSKFQKQSQTNPSTSQRFIQQDAIQKLFSVLQRIQSNIYHFSTDYELSQSVLFSASEALTVLLDKPETAAQAGQRFSNIFTIIISLLKQSKQLEARSSLLNLISRLSLSKQNAQIFLEHKIVDYVSYLALEAQNCQSLGLKAAVASSVSALCENAPNYRARKDEFYGDGSVLAEFGRRGVVDIMCEFVSFDAQQISLPEFRSVKYATFAVAGLSKCARNCLLMWKFGIVEKLLKCVRFGDLEMKKMAAVGIRNVRKSLQGIGECAGQVEGPGLYAAK